MSDRNPRQRGSRASSARLGVRGAQVPILSSRQKSPDEKLFPLRASFVFGVLRSVPSRVRNRSSGALLARVDIGAKEVSGPKSGSLVGQSPGKHHALPPRGAGVGVPGQSSVDEPMGGDHTASGSPHPGPMSDPWLCLRTRQRWGLQSSRAGMRCQPGATVRRSCPGVHARAWERTSAPG